MKVRHAFCSSHQQGVLAGLVLVEASQLPLHLNLQLLQPIQEDSTSLQLHNLAVLDSTLLVRIKLQLEPSPSGIMSNPYCYSLHGGPACITGGGLLVLFFILQILSILTDDY